MGCNNNHCKPPATIGELKHRISIRQVTLQSAGFGNSTSSKKNYAETVIANRKAKLETKKGSQYFDGMANIERPTHIFTCYFVPDLGIIASEGDFSGYDLVLGTKKFIIDSVMNWQEEDKWHIISCKIKGLTSRNASKGIV